MTKIIYQIQKLFIQTCYIFNDNFYLHVLLSLQFGEIVNKNV